MAGISRAGGWIAGHTWRKTNAGNNGSVSHWIHWKLKVFSLISAETCLKAYWLSDLDSHRHLASLNPGIIKTRSLDLPFCVKMQRMVWWHNPQHRTLYGNVLLIRTASHYASYLQYGLIAVKFLKGKNRLQSGVKLLMITRGGYASEPVSYFYSACSPIKSYRCKTLSKFGRKWTNLVISSPCLY